MEQGDDGEREDMDKWVDAFTSQLTERECKNMNSHTGSVFNRTTNLRETGTLSYGKSKEFR